MAKHQYVIVTNPDSFSDYAICNMQTRQVFLIHSDGTEITRAYLRKELNWTIAIKSKTIIEISRTKHFSRARAVIKTLGLLKT